MKGVRTSTTLKTLGLLICHLYLVACTSSPRPQVDSPASLRIPSSSIKEELGPHLDVLVWNTYKGSRSQFKEDAYRLMRNKDLVLFQECVLEREFEKIANFKDKLEMEYAQSWGKNGVCTSSNVVALDVHAIRTDVKEFFFFTPKSSLITSYPIRSEKGELQELLVINVHMINFRAVYAFQKHLEQLRETLEQHEGPIIVAGDFNTWIGARERRVERFLQEFGLTEVDFHQNKSLRDPRTLTFGILDRAFIRGLEVRQTQVYQEVNSSDHKPFSFQLTLP